VQKRPYSEGFYGSRPESIFYPYNVERILLNFLSCREIINNGLANSGG